MEFEVHHNHLRSVHRVRVIDELQHHLSRLLAGDALSAKFFEVNCLSVLKFQKQLNFDAFQINNCMFTVRVSDIFSRLLYPLISRSIRLRSRYIFMIGVLGLGAVRLMLLNMELDNFKLLLMVCAVLGFFRALTVVNQVLILVDFCEENCPTKLPGTLGLSVVIKAMMLVIFGWAFNGMWLFTLNLTLNLYSQIFLFIILILVWLLEPRTLSFTETEIH